MRSLLFFTLFFISGCSHSPSNNVNNRVLSDDDVVKSLEGSTWVCEIAEGCINRYQFESDSLFTFFSCEMDEMYYGVYYFSDGFLMIEQKGIVDEENFHDHSTQQEERRLYKVLVDGDEFVHLSVSDRVDGRWKLSDFKLDPQYRYHREL